MSLHRSALRIHLGLAVAVLGISAVPALAVPYQFIAKTYTEGLGRLPDQGGWAGVVSYYNSNGCSKNTLKTWGRTVYLSAEFGGLGYDSAAQVLTVYRGILNREPDASGLTNYINLLNGGTPLATVVDAFYDSAEFAGLVSAICNQDSYSFGGMPVANLPVTTGGFQGTQAQLQAALNATAPGGTVTLAQKAVVRLTSTLLIPAGVTLATLGNPDHSHYALMGRLVRNSAFGGAAVQLAPGARLLSVWVDGQRGVVGDNRASLSVQLLGGTGTTVSSSVITNSSGWSSLQAFGSAESQPCGGNQIDHNLITAYSSSHLNNLWTDGLSIACENATVEFNEILDATDVHIVLFRSGPATQRSQIRFNTFLAAGNSAYGGIVADPLNFNPALGQSAVTYDFTGSSVHDNTFWSGKGHYDIALSLGTRAWFGPNNHRGTGASFTANTTGSQRALCDVCIGVSGMFNATVQGNNLISSLTNSGNCPTPGGSPASVNVGVSTLDGQASGSFQPFTAISMPQCIGH